MFHPEGSILASSSSDNTIKLWDVVTGKCWQTLAEHTSYVWSLSFSEDGHLLASGSEDKTICQSLILLSLLPLAKIVPSGLKAREKIHPACSL